MIGSKMMRLYYVVLYDVVQGRENRHPGKDAYLLSVDV